MSRILVKLAEFWSNSVGEIFVELAEFWPQWRYFGKVDDIFLKLKLRFMLADNLEIFCSIAAKVGISSKWLSRKGAAAPCREADKVGGILVELVEFPESVWVARLFRCQYGLRISGFGFRWFSSYDLNCQSSGRWDSGSGEKLIQLSLK